LALELICADSHVNPLPSMWADYLPARLRDRAPRVESTEEGDFQVFEGRRSPILGISAMAGKKPEDFSWNIRRLEDQRAGGYDPTARLEDMDLDHIEAEVLYGGGPLRSQDPELCRASTSAYNDWLADFCSAAPSRLIGMAYIPWQTPEGAIAEMRRCADKGLRGCMLPRFPEDDGQWHDERWDPIWSVLIDLGWPGGIHVGGTGRKMEAPDVDPTGFMTGVMMSKFAMAEACTRLVVSGVLARHPDLKLVAVEGQIGWIPFVHYYLDHIWEKHRYWTKSQLPEPPSTYFRRQVYATFMEDPVGLGQREAIGVENIMWSSDYPHSETTWPDSKKLTDEWMADYPEEDHRKIVFENAQKLYHI